ncbi:MAG: hypothetical protein ACAH04_10770 [Methylibium sp.]
MSWARCSDPVSEAHLAGTFPPAVPIHRGDWDIAYIKPETDR